MRSSYCWVRWSSGALHGGHGEPSSHRCLFLISRSAGEGGKRDKWSLLKAAHPVTPLPPTAHSWGDAGGGDWPLGRADLGCSPQRRAWVSALPGALQSQTSFPLLVHLV